MAPQRLRKRQSRDEDSSSERRESSATSTRRGRSGARDPSPVRRRPPPGSRGRSRRPPSPARSNSPPPSRSPPPRTSAAPEPTSEPPTPSSAIPQGDNPTIQTIPQTLPTDTPATTEATNSAANSSSIPPSNVLSPAVLIAIIGSVLGFILFIVVCMCLRHKKTLLRRGGQSPRPYSKAPDISPLKADIKSIDNGSAVVVDSNLLAPPTSESEQEVAKPQIAYHPSPDVTITQEQLDNNGDFHNQRYDFYETSGDPASYHSCEQGFYVYDSNNPTENVVNVDYISPAHNNNIVNSSPTGDDKKRPASCIDQQISKDLYPSVRFDQKRSSVQKTPQRAIGGNIISSPATTATTTRPMLFQPMRSASRLNQHQTSGSTPKSSRLNRKFSVASKKSLNSFYIKNLF